MRAAAALLISSLTLLAADLPRRAYFGAAFRPAEGGAVAVADVLPGSPAEAAGLRAGDVLVRLNGKAVTNPGEVVTMVRQGAAGSAFDAELQRSGQTVNLQIKLGSAPKETSTDFDIVYDAIPVRGALRRIVVTKPKGDGEKRAAVLLVGGIGCYPADNAVGQDAYREILYRLTREGFVTMRVEKSGIGDSQGTPCPAVDFDTEVDGYREGLRALRAMPAVDPAKVFIFGHSMGGLEAPLLAQDLPLRGLMVMATVGSSWYEYELANSRRQQALSGESEPAVDREVAHRRDCVHALLITKVDKAPGCEDTQHPASLAYMRQVIALNVGEAWSKSTVPVLVMYGKSDFVAGEADHQFLTDRLNRMTPGRATYMAIDQLDHFFNRRESQRASMNAEARGSGASVEMHLDWVPGMIGWMRARLG